jgi:hypothetical protein
MLEHSGQLSNMAKSGWVVRLHINEHRIGAESEVGPIPGVEPHVHQASAVQVQVSLHSKESNLAIGVPDSQVHEKAPGPGCWIYRCLPSVSFLYLCANHCVIGDANHRLGSDDLAQLRVTAIPQSKDLPELVPVPLHAHPAEGFGTRSRPMAR